MALWKLWKRGFGMPRQKAVSFGGEAEEQWFKVQAILGNLGALGGGAGDFGTTSGLRVPADATGAS